MRTKKSKRTYITYTEAKTIVQSVEPKLKNQLDYTYWYEDNKATISNSFPPKPQTQFEGWVDWYDFLGKERPIKKVA
jgi:hypothetical protein